jgi:lysophospholipase L1-like esterase
MSIRGRAVHTLLTKFSPGARLQSQILPSAPGDLVFIGDGLSLHGEWSEWFPRASVRVLGDELLLIDDARELVARVISPRALVLLVGSADLLGMGGPSSPARAATRLEALLRFATDHIDAASIFVVGVPLRPVFGDRAADFNRSAAAIVGTAGSTFVPAPAYGGNEADGYMVSPLRWDATVYSQLAEELASATGLTLAQGRSVPALSDVGKGFVVKMERKRAQLFETLPPTQGRVVLFGDSITEGGFWDGWLPGIPVANRGIGGDTVAQLAARVDSAIDSPLVVSVLAGTNDLVRGDPKDAESIGERFRDLIAQIRERDATVPIVINSVMPRGKKYIDSILTINTHYRDIASEFDACYLDLWPALATPDKTLRKELTPDGLHMNGSGYREWVSVLRPAIERVLGGRTDSQ